MSAGQSTRPVKVIVGDALDELREREAREQMTEAWKRR